MGALRLTEVTLDLNSFKKRLGRSVIELYNKSLEVIESGLRRTRSLEGALDSIEDALGSEASQLIKEGKLAVVLEQTNLNELTEVIPEINFIYCSRYESTDNLFEEFMSEAEETVGSLCRQVKSSFIREERDRLMLELDNRGLEGSFIASPLFDTELNKIPSSYVVKDANGYVFFTFDCQTSYAIEDLTFLWANLNLSMLR